MQDNVDYSSSYNADELPMYCVKDGYPFQPSDMRCPRCHKERITMKRVAPEVKWEKVLYKKQKFADNHLDETFLESLITSEQSYNLKYQNVVPKALEVSLALAQVSFFMIVFDAILNNKVHANWILIILGISSVSGAFLYILIAPKIMKLHSILSNIKSAGIIVGFLFILSPVLKTFNSNYSSDTIYAISFGLIIFHLISKDYGFIFDKGNTGDINIDNSTLSIFFLSVLLGSRFIDSIQVFVLWIINLMLFVFLKYLLKAVRAYSVRAYIYLISTIIIAVAFPIYKISKIVVIVYIFGNFFIALVCPFWLIWLYQYKNVIHGPWDLPDVKQHAD
jgi:phosphatidylinositol glycan class C protein